MREILRRAVTRKRLEVIVACAAACAFALAGAGARGQQSGASANPTQNLQGQLPTAKPVPAPTMPAPRSVYAKELARVTFAAAGDVIPHQAVTQSASAARKNSAMETKEKSRFGEVAQNSGASAQDGAASGQGGAATPNAASSNAPIVGNASDVAKQLAGQVKPKTDSASSGATQQAEQPLGAVPAQAMHLGDDDGWDEEFADVADVFRSVDFGFVNMETPVAPKHSIGSKAFQFEAPVALIEALKFSGVKIVSFANNHVFDQGYPGFNETIEHLRAEGMLFAGSGDSADDAWKPVIVEKNGMKIGFLGMTRWLNGRRNPEKDSAPHVAFFPYPGEAGGAPGRDEAGVLEAIKAAKAQCDFLIVSIHWGIEYAPAPRPEDEDTAHKFLEAGAGMVIGHHPHVLQPMETYQTQDGRRCIIIYSLGNFLSNQSRDYVNGLAPDKDGDPRDEMMVKFSVVKKDYGAGGVQFELADVGALPIWEENNHLRLRNGKEKTPVIKPEFVDRLIPQLQARMDSLNAMPQPLAVEQKQEFVQVTQELETLKHRREIILARVGDDYVVAPPAQ